MTGDDDGVTIQERIVLHKYDGDPSPENLVEVVHVEDGQIVHHVTVTE